MSFISKRFGQFAYFDLQLGKPNWRGKRVLDFGGNVGNILKDPNSTIDRDKYWCIDVSRDAIEEGKQTYPEANWLFYNRYNFAFNSTGIEGLELPDTGQEFDYILGYSVFTHTSRAEMLELVSQLSRQLAINGVLAFTFIDPHFNPAGSGSHLHPGYHSGTCLRQRLERMKENAPGVDVESLLRRAANASWCTLANDDDLYIESESVRHYDENEKRSYCAFYTDAYMRTIFPQAAVLPPRHKAYPASVESVLQHCCILRKTGGHD